MPTYTTNDWRDSIAAMRCGGWTTAKAIFATTSDIKFLMKTLETELLSMVDKSTRGRVVVESPPVQLKTDWIKLDTGEFIRRKDMEKIDKETKELEEEIEKVERIIAQGRARGVINKK